MEASENKSTEQLLDELVGDLENDESGFSTYSAEALAIAYELQDRHNE